MTAAVLIGIGYTNFSGNAGIPKNLSSNTLAVSSTSTNNIGDVQLVSSSSALVENDDNAVAQEDIQETSSDALVSNDGENSAISNESIATSSSDNKNYFSELKMQRNDMYSKSMETYQKIIDSSTISSEQKAIAIQEIEKINKLQNSIQISEELIKLKGFEDVVIYSSEGKISVIVRIAALSDAQVAQIQNIVSKELNVGVSDITISNK